MCFFLKKILKNFIFNSNRAPVLLALVAGDAAAVMEEVSQVKNKTQKNGISGL